MSKSEANPSDVSSIDAIVTAAYDSISGPAGEKRNWDRERSLYFPGARLIPTARPVTSDEGQVTSENKIAPQILDVDGFIARVAPNSLATSPMSGAFMSRATTKPIPNRLCAASTAFSYSTTENAGGS